MSRSTRDRDNAIVTTWQIVEKTLAERLSNIHHQYVVVEEDAFDLRLKKRPDGSWLAIAKRVSDSGDIQVCLASAYDFIGTLQALNAAMAANAWKQERKWEPGSGA